MESEELLETCLSELKFYFLCQVFGRFKISFLKQSVCVRNKLLYLWDTSLQYKQMAQTERYVKSKQILKMLETTHGDIKLDLLVLFLYCVGCNEGHHTLTDKFTNNQRLHSQNFKSHADTFKTCRH